MRPGYPAHLADWGAVKLIPQRLKNFLIARSAVGVVLTTWIGVGIPSLYAARIIRFAQRSKAHGDYDLIVVPGAAQYDGRPCRTFEARLRRAAELWQEQEHSSESTICVLGGKLPGDRFTEGEAGVNWLSHRDIPRGNLLPITYGHDTRESLKKLLEQLGPQGAEKRMLIVTDPRHLLRCTILAERVGFNNVGAEATPYLPVQTPWTLLHEIGGLMVVDISGIFGRDVASQIEDALRQVAVWLKPSRKARFDQLHQEKEEREK